MNSLKDKANHLNKLWDSRDVNREKTINDLIDESRRKERIENKHESRPYGFQDELLLEIREFNETLRHLSCTSSGRGISIFDVLIGVAITCVVFILSEQIKL